MYGTVRSFALFWRGCSPLGSVLCAGARSPCSVAVHLAASGSRTYKTATRPELREAVTHLDVLYVPRGLTINSLQKGSLFFKKRGVFI